MPEPTADEQYMLELVNAERATAGVQPLAFDFDLNESAELHSQWMIATDTFSHEGANGSTPTQRMQAAGYPLTGSWTTGENIAWQSLRGAVGIRDDVADLHVALMNSPGHRANILNASFREVGIGVEVGQYQDWQGAFVTQNFAKTGSAYFITGVAFDDRDGDLAYDPGEGLAGMAVTVTNLSGGAASTATTYGSGGYDVAVAPGTYAVTFSGGGFASVSRTVTVGTANVKVDWADPSVGGASATAGNDNLTGTPLYGGAGDDTLTGTAGQDYLRGEDGNDRLVGGDAWDDLHGNQGDDTVSGGLGDDWVVGGQHQDRLFGDEGHDVVLGNLGDDTLDGGTGNDVVRGGQANDVLTGGWGDDFLAGDRGDDTITRGGGADTFHTWGDAGVDRVLDFNSAEGDRVNLLPGTTYSVAQVGADVVISMGGGGRMVLVGVQRASLTGDWIFGA